LLRFYISTRHGGVLDQADWETIFGRDPEQAGLGDAARARDQ
jgi:hypothetical protein